jgi:hypothetical protein
LLAQPSNPNDQHADQRFVNAAARSGALALACAGLSGCAILPAVGINLAAQGVAALAVTPIAAMAQRDDKDRCVAARGNGIAVTESLETLIPAGPGQGRVFEPAYWRPEFEGEGYPQSERSRTPVEGTVAITDRSVLLVPAQGGASIRIPYEVVLDVSVHRSAVTGEPRSTIVKSCAGRYDIFTFAERPSNRLDAEATTAAAAELKARVAAFDAAAGN